MSKTAKVATPAKRPVFLADVASKEEGSPFRVIMRATKGDVRRRSVRTVYATNLSAAEAFIAAKGDEILKSVTIGAVDFVKPAMPLKALYSTAPDAIATLKTLAK